MYDINKYNLHIHMHTQITQNYSHKGFDSRLNTDFLHSKKIEKEIFRITITNMTQLVSI